MRFRKCLLFVCAVLSGCVYRGGKDIDCITSMELQQIIETKTPLKYYDAIPFWEYYKGCTIRSGFVLCEPESSASRDLEICAYCNPELKKNIGPNLICSLEKMLGDIFFYFLSKKIENRLDSANNNSDLENSKIQRDFRHWKAVKTSGRKKYVKKIGKDDLKGKFVRFSLDYIDDPSMDFTKHAPVPAPAHACRRECGMKNGGPCLNSNDCNMRNGFAPSIFLYKRTSDEVHFPYFQVECKDDCLDCNKSQYGNIVTMARVEYRVIEQKVEIDHLLRDNDYVIELPRSLHSLKTELLDYFIPFRTSVIRGNHFETGSYWKSRRSGIKKTSCN